MDIGEFLEPYNSEIREIALKARALILELAPDVIEQIDTSDKLVAYGYGLKMGDTLCTIAPYKSWVNMGFYRGLELPDPAGLLTGTGKLHRHVKLKTLAEVETPALRELLLAAITAKKS
jgi:hypothetical protein